MKITPRILRFLLNLYGPFLGAGVKVTRVGDDWKHIRVSMKLRFYNRNVVGTHFGGSLYSMADPHYMLMLMNLLGPEYIVWDKSASIDFLRPGNGTVYADCTIAEDELQAIREQTREGKPCSPEFSVKVVNAQGKAVARIRKVLYVRRKTVDSGA